MADGFPAREVLPQGLWPGRCHARSDCGDEIFCLDQELELPASLARVSPASSDSVVSSPILKPAAWETLITAWSASRKALTALKACVAVSSGNPNSDVGSCIQATPQFGQRSGRFVQRMRGKLTAVRHSMQRKKTARISSRSKVIPWSPSQSSCPAPPNRFFLPASQMSSALKPCKFVVGSLWLSPFLC